MAYFVFSIVSFCQKWWGREQQKKTFPGYGIKCIFCKINAFIFDTFLISASSVFVKYSGEGQIKNKYIVCFIVDGSNMME